jgi:hypothetical protein
MASAMRLNGVIMAAMAKNLSANAMKMKANDQCRNNILYINIGSIVAK